MTALTWLVATPLSVWWYGEPLYGEPVKILALGAPLAVLTLAMTTALQSVSRMHSIALVEVWAKTIHTLLGVGAMVAGLGLTGLVSATVISQAVGCAIGLLAYQRILHRLPRLCLPPGRGGDGDHRAVAGLLPLQRPGSCGQEHRCALRTDTRAPPRPLMPPEQAAFYDAARKVLSFLAVFHGAVARKLRASLGERKGQAGLGAARSVFWRVTLLWTPLALVLAAVLALCLPLFRLALTPEIFPSLTLVIIFALHTGLMALGVGFGSVFLLTDRIGLNIAIKTPINLACLPLGALLVMQWGAEGAGALYAGGLQRRVRGLSQPAGLQPVLEDQRPAPRRSQPTGQSMKVLHVSPLFFGADGVVGGGERYPLEAGVGDGPAYADAAVLVRAAPAPRAPRRVGHRGGASAALPGWQERQPALGGLSAPTCSGPTSFTAIRCIPS